MILKCIIIDDEEPARDELKFFLSKIDYIEVLGEAHSANHAYEIIENLEPDIIFLDIEMPGHNGFFLVEKLKSLKKIPYIIFATAYNEYAVKAFEADAADYVLKPFSFERLVASVEKVKKRKDISDDFSGSELEKITRIVSSIPSFSKVPLVKEGRMILVSPEDIIYFEALGKDIEANLSDEILYLQKDVTMEKLESRLFTNGFFRTHRSFLVNLNHIKEFYSWFGGKYELVMDNDENSKIPVSRNRVKDFKKKVTI